MFSSGKLFACNLSILSCPKLPGDMYSVFSINALIFFLFCGPFVNLFDSVSVFHVRGCP